VHPTRTPHIEHPHRGKREGRPNATGLHGRGGPSAAAAARSVVPPSPAAEGSRSAPRHCLCTSVAEHRKYPCQGWGGIKQGLLTSCSSRRGAVLLLLEILRLSSRAGISANQMRPFVHAPRPAHLHRAIGMCTKCAERPAVTDMVRRSSRRASHRYSASAGDHAARGGAAAFTPLAHLAIRRTTAPSLQSCGTRMHFFF
jgi:hypothetical protein